MLVVVWFGKCGGVVAGTGGGRGGTTAAVVLPWLTIVVPDLQQTCDQIDNYFSLNANLFLAKIIH